MTVLAKAGKIGYKLGRDKRYQRMGAKGATGCWPFGQRQERVGGTMVTVPQRVSSQTEQDCLCVGSMTTPV